MKHHESCKKHNIEIVFHCNQCGDIEYVGDDIMKVIDKYLSKTWEKKETKK